MDLSGNICALCCTLHPRSLLTRLSPDTEFLSLLLGQEGVLVCANCRAKVVNFRNWWEECRGNLARLRQIQGEQEGVWEQQQPDSTWSREEGGGERSQGGIEISVAKEDKEEILSDKADNSITITKIDRLETEAERINQIREANRLRNVKYRERKRARETELKTYLSCLSNSLDVQTTALDLVSKRIDPKDVPDTMNVTPDLVFHNDEQAYSLKQEEAVSPPSSPLQVAIQGPSLPMFPLNESGDPKNHSSEPNREPINQEERRRHRNREASRRYREKARGDPDLLKKMREQQNKRQKKYYARLKEKKQGGKLLSVPSPWFQGLVLPFPPVSPLPPSSSSLSSIVKSQQ